MRIIFILCLIIFFLSCGEKEKVLYELYQGGVKIDEVCAPQRYKGSFSDEGTYYKMTNKKCDK